VGKIARPTIQCSRSHGCFGSRAQVEDNYFASFGGRLTGWREGSLISRPPSSSIRLRMDSARFRVWEVSWGRASLALPRFDFGLLVLDIAVGPLL